MSKLGPYLYIARPDHWFKNVFMLPGVALALVMSPESLSTHMGSAFIGLVALCLLASANYTINEFLDARHDSHHPVKKHRPSVTGQERLNSPSLVPPNSLRIMLRGTTQPARAATSSPLSGSSTLPLRKSRRPCSSCFPMPEWLAWTGTP